MKTEIKKFLEFNGKTIFFVAIDGQYWIALKSICEALNVNWKYQHEKLLKDKILGQLSRNIGMVAADGKLRKMVALPEFVIYGWIFKIESLAEGMDEYQWECYKVLYNYFHGMITQREQLLKTKTLDELEIERLEAELEDSEQYKLIVELKKRNKQKLTQLRNLDKSLVDSQLDLWKQEKSEIVLS